MIEDKQKLITFICVALRNFIVVQIALNRLKEDPWFPKEVTFSTQTKKITLPIKELFIDKKTGNLINTKEVFNNCTRSQSRAILSETFEVIKKYCEDTDQLDSFKSWKFYNFARILRNTTSHGTGGRLNKWPPDLKKKGIVSVSWRQINIDDSIVGKRISMTDPEIIQFIRDQLDFVKQSLN